MMEVDTLKHGYFYLVNEIYQGDHCLFIKDRHDYILSIDYVENDGCYLDARIDGKFVRLANDSLDDEYCFLVQVYRDGAWHVEKKIHQLSSVEQVNLTEEDIREPLFEDIA
jgi:hypothetical protein